ncbi:Osmotin-like protein [Actinidia chinensis var. chinensis]|uniref:Osmotin-like protein n=1 Tax=Actinidia chinensis var. chinensis TaxID=1590841 RepID=A0A2R6QT11_ACTCC|nr:Osmotin-like protein [Actinidia chinensis var. chinensis]
MPDKWQGCCNDFGNTARPYRTPRSRSYTPPLGHVPPVTGAGARRGRRRGAVDEADAVGGEVEVAAVVEAELGEGGWGGASGAGALDAAAAVAGGAGEAAVGVGAGGAGPDAAGPVLFGAGEGAVGELVEVEPAALEDGVAGVGLDGGPDGVGTVVDYGYYEVRVGCMGAGGEEEEERE